MSNFEWQQEDEDWHESLSQPAPEPLKPKRRLYIVAVFVMALLAAGLVLYRQVNEQLRQTETAVQTDILASHNLVQTAAATGDFELFLSVLSGRLPSWTDAQREALSAGVLYDRELWGLELAARAPSILATSDLATAASLTMSSDLREAELRFPLTYQSTSATGVSETIVLSQTAVYRQGGRSWLLAPPTSQFWGGWQTNKGKRLTLIYPDRDAELAEKLAVDLEQIIQRICTEPDLPDCADDAAYAIRLDTHPESLVEAVDKRNLFGEQPYLNLPAPTLLGLPVDDAGYEALVRAYSVPLVTAVFAELVGWECCGHAPVFQALAGYELDRLGIQPWPVTTDFHARALRESISLEDLNNLWRQYEFTSSLEENWHLYAALDFLLNKYPDLTPAHLLEDINNQSNLSIWLSDALNRAGYQTRGRMVGLETLNSEWWHYAYTQTLLAQNNDPPPLPLPEQNMLLLCMSDENYDVSTTMSLVQFDQQTEIWTGLWAGNGFLLINPLLNDDGVILQTFAMEETETWQTEIWQFGGERTTLISEDYMSISLGQFDPTGQYAVIFIGEAEQVAPQPNLIDIASCSEGTCDIVPLPGLPYWSPDGRQTIVADVDIIDNSVFLRNGSMILLDASQLPDMVDLWLGDETGQISESPEQAAVIGQGYSPFWVDDDTIGYVRLQEDGEPAVVLNSLNGDSLRTVLTLADIQNAVPAGVGGPDSIRYVITHPAAPDLLVVAALDALGREVTVFTYDVASGGLDLRLQSLVHPFHTLGFSPNGRWLVLTGLGENQRGDISTLYVHDIENDETRTYISENASFVLTPLYDWSADGNWLLFLVDDRVLSMAAPAYDYQRVLAHEQGNCTAMTWINRRIDD